MINAEILAEYSAACAAMAPEGPLPYILQQPDAWPTPEACDAYALPRVPWFVRDHLKSTGAWRGFQPAIVFVAPLDDSRECRGIFVHELSHILPAREPIPDCDSSPEERNWQIERFNHIAATPFVDDAPPWDGHDLAFIRRCLHLHHRAVNLGWSLSLSDLNIAGRFYGLSHALYYWVAINNEPDCMASATFAEIEQTQPPAAFSKLWDSDAAAWHRAQNNFQKLEQVA